MDLKLFTARVIWDDFYERENAWFTVLGKDAEDVEEAVTTRLREWNVGGPGASPLMLAPSDISVMEVTEIVGPFKAGQILHEETGGDIKT